MWSMSSSSASSTAFPGLREPPPQQEPVQPMHPNMQLVPPAQAGQQQTTPPGGSRQGQPTDDTGAQSFPAISHRLCPCI